MAKHIRKVSLRILDPQRDLRLFEDWLRRPHVTRWWGNHDVHLTTVKLRSEGTHALIDADGRSVGYLCWQKPSREELEAAGLTDLPEGLVDIDIMIGEPEFIGCGVGLRALTLLLANSEHLRRPGFAFFAISRIRIMDRADI